MPLALYKELYDVRSKSLKLKDHLNDLNTTCKTRCTNDLQNCIYETMDELEHLSIRRHILEKLCRKILV